MATHAHDPHAPGKHHVLPWQVLVGVFSALIALITILTVLATKVDLGSNYNLALAMAIAAVKGTLVILYFMHLRYDKLFHSVLFVGGILTATLFVTFSLMDSRRIHRSPSFGIPRASSRRPLRPQPPPVNAPPPHAAAASAATIASHCCR